MAPQIAESKKRRVRALIIKETLQIIRDPSAILIILVLPLFLMFLYGYGVSLDLNHLRLGIVMEDTAPDAGRLVSSFKGSRFFDLTIVRDTRELLDDLQKGAIRGFVVIPSYFSEFRSRQSQMAPIFVVADGSETNTANFVQDYAAGAFSNWLVQESISYDLGGLPLVQPQPRVWYNEQLESRFFLLSGSLAIIMTLIGTLLTALVVAREWERGTMEALMSTSVTTFELVVGKLIPYFVLGMISMIICIFVSVFVFGLPLRGSFLLLILVSANFLIGALALGLLISTVARNQIIAYQISMVTGFLPAYILSGFLFEIKSMPIWIQFLTYLMPARYFVQSLQTLFLVGNVWRLVLIDMCAMTIMGIFFFIMTARKTKKRLD